MDIESFKDVGNKFPKLSIIQSIKGIINVRYWLLPISIVVMFVISVSAKSAVDCDVPELYYGHYDYNDLVCAGVKSMEKQKYREAALLFDKALAKRLFEVPNFELLPRLALALYLAGEANRAEHVLLRSELSLLVYFGLMKCEEKETGPGYRLLDANGNRVVSQASDEVVLEMCSEMYQSYYGYDVYTIRGVLYNYELVEDYFEAKQQIAMPSSYSTGMSVSNSVDCDVPEVVDGYSHYNELVCYGIRKIEEQRYEDAAVLFREALHIPLGEVPNFALSSRLALALYLAGEFERSEYILLKAGLSLSVFLGITQCEETSTGYDLHDIDGGRFTSQASHEVAAIMCGATYNYEYNPQTLEQIFLQGKLVKNYFEIKRRIQMLSFQ